MNTISTPSTLTKCSHDNCMCHNSLGHFKDTVIVSHNLHHVSEQLEFSTDVHQVTEFIGMHLILSLRLQCNKL